MYNIRIFIDFGSTYTKVVAIDLDKEEIVAQTRVPSTVYTDITIGLKEALAIISMTAGIDDLAEKKALACSSAAGGCAWSASASSRNIPVKPPTWQLWCRGQSSRTFLIRT
jgi:sugar (pentulose or hexulose) kinase